jgi:hypothetical protein
VPNLFRKSIHLTTEEFYLFKNCKMSLTQYKDLLISKGILR